VVVPYHQYHVLGELSYLASVETPILHHSFV
jgi:hypothetical protein